MDDRMFFFLMDLSDVSTFKSVLFQTHLYTHRIHVYGIFTCVYHTNQAKVGKSTIRGSYGISYPRLPNTLFLEVFEPKKSYPKETKPEQKVFGRLGI